MSSKEKLEVRKNFRYKVLERDCCICQFCNLKPWNVDEELDVHHITDRHEFINGGYVLENGITLCKYCHYRAEKGSISRELLYKKISSSFELAKEVDGKMDIKARYTQLKDLVNDHKKEIKKLELDIQKLQLYCDHKNSYNTYGAMSDCTYLNCPDCGLVKDS